MKRTTKRTIRIDGHTVVIVCNGKNLIQVIRPNTSNVPDELYRNVMAGIG